MHASFTVRVWAFPTHARVKRSMIAFSSISLSLWRTAARPRSARTIIDWLTLIVREIHQPYQSYRERVGPGTGRHQPGLPDPRWRAQTRRCKKDVCFSLTASTRCKKSSHIVSFSFTFCFMGSACLVWLSLASIVLDCSISSQLLQWPIGGGNFGHFSSRRSATGWPNPTRRAFRRKSSLLLLYDTKHAR